MKRVYIERDKACEKTRRGIHNKVYSKTYIKTYGKAYRWLFALVFLAVFGGLIFTVGQANKKVEAVAEKAAVETYFDTTVEDTLSGNWSYSKALSYYSSNGGLIEETLLDQNKNLNLVYTANKQVYIRVMNIDGRVSKTIKIPYRQSNYGGITIDENGNYYLAFATDKTGGYATIEIAKYNNNGTFIKSYKDTPFSHVRVFDLNDARMAISNGVLAIIYSIKASNGHNMNENLFLDIDTMAIAESHRGRSTYVSHDMDNDVIALENGVFSFISQGDGYPRGFRACVLNDVAYCNTIFNFREGANANGAYNYTFANYGSNVAINNNQTLVLAATSEKTLTTDYAPNYIENEARNVFVQFYKRSSLEANKGMKAGDFLTSGVRESTGTTFHSSETLVQVSGANRTNMFFAYSGPVTNYGVKWLTDYTGTPGTKGSQSSYAVKAVGIDNDRVMVMWNELTYTGENTSVDKELYAYYVILDKNANIVQGKTLIPYGYVPNNAQPVYDNGYVYFSNSFYNSDIIRTYKIKIGETTTAEKPVAAKSVSFDAVEYSGFVGGGDAINYHLTPANANYYVMNFYSGDESVAKIDKDGKITFVGAGETYVYMETDFSGTLAFKVKVYDDTVALSFTKDLVVMGYGTLDLTQYLKASDGSELSKLGGWDYAVISENKDLVRKDANGKLYFSPDAVEQYYTVQVTYGKHKSIMQVHVISERGGSSSDIAAKQDSNAAVGVGEQQTVTLYHKEGAGEDRIKNANQVEFDINYDASNIAVMKYRELDERVSASMPSEGTLHVVFDAGDDSVNVNTMEFVEIVFTSKVAADTSNQILLNNAKYTTLPGGTSSNYTNLTTTGGRLIYVGTSPLKIKTKAIDNPITSVRIVCSYYCGSTNILTLKMGESAPMGWYSTPSKYETTDDTSVTFLFSDPSVVSVDTTSSMDPKFIAQKVGATTVQYMVGDVRSNKMQIVVLDENGYAKGDINKDGKVNATDVRALWGEISFGAASDKTPYELNGDGKVTVMDVRALWKYISFGEW